ncbi:MAG: hypothetical protein QM504_01655 [Pseudomonadota bacterium]
MLAIKKIMKKAWKIARKACIKYGGKSHDYISCSLKISWVKAKLINTGYRIFSGNDSDIESGKTLIAVVSILNEIWIK